MESVVACHAEQLPGADSLTGASDPERSPRCRMQDRLMRSHQACWRAEQASSCCKRVWSGRNWPVAIRSTAHRLGCVRRTVSDVPSVSAPAASLV
jgi:hypothetical protein